MIKRELVISSFEGGSLNNEENGHLYGQDALAFKDGIIVVYPGQVGKGFGVMDINGKWILEPEYRFMDYEDGIISTLKEKEGRFIYFDITGKTLFEKNYPCTAFRDNYAFYIEKKRIYMMDRSGKTGLEIPEGYIPEDAYIIWNDWSRNK